MVVGDASGAIIDQATWDAVQAKLAERRYNDPRRRKITERPLLEGKVFDDRGHPMIVVHTQRRGRRYRYYLSKAKHTGEGTPGSLPRIAAGRGL